MSAAKRSFFTDQISLAQRPGAVKPQTIFRRRRRKKMQPLKKSFPPRAGRVLKNIFGQRWSAPPEWLLLARTRVKAGCPQSPGCPRRKLLLARTRVKAGVLGGLIILYFGLCPRPRAGQNGEGKSVIAACP